MCTVAMAAAASVSRLFLRSLYEVLQLLSVDVLMSVMVLVWWLCQLERNVLWCVCVDPKTISCDLN